MIPLISLTDTVMRLRATKALLFVFATLLVGACEVSYLDECRIEEDGLELTYGRAIGGGAAGFQDSYIYLSHVDSRQVISRSDRILFPFSEVGQAWLSEDGRQLFLDIHNDALRSHQRSDVRFDGNVIEVTEGALPNLVGRIGISWRLEADGFKCSEVRQTSATRG